MPVWLVLSGSGMRLYAFLGALLYLVEHGVLFTGVTATSGGAVVGALLGKHWDATDPVASVRRTIDEVLSIDPALELRKSARWRVWEWLLTKVLRQGPKGAFSTATLLKKFRKHLPATIADSKLPLQITAYQVNLRSPRPVLFTSPNTDLPAAVIGSMGLPPPLFDPPMYGKAMLQDGGWVANLPIPEDQPKVLALYFGNVDATEGRGIVEDPERLVTIDDNIELWAKAILGLIDTNMRDAILRAASSSQCVTAIRLGTSLGGLDFLADKSKLEQAIQEGYDSAAVAYRLPPSSKT